VSTVRIAIVGVGNCASSLVQGLFHYRDADPSQDVPGLMHVELERSTRSGRRRRRCSRSGGARRLDRSRGRLGFRLLLLAATTKKKGEAKDGREPQ
jgi:hypothetical protein